GGWSDYQSQRGAMVGDGKPDKKKKQSRTKPADKSAETGLSFVEQHRLEELPAVIERLEAEINKLADFLSDPDMFTKEPMKFQKGTDALVERQAMLDAAEEEWMMLEEKASG
ncbi:MAG TPA: ABC transporter ATP-binding protein, partial [Rhodobacteraceae bacterium]|nr:ABC transporter ATP-binding protein [Paracoccaceae bacterium]